MTHPDRLNKLKARLAAATQEPWACEPSPDGKEVYGLLIGDGAVSFDNVRTADIDLINFAPDDLRWAIDEIDRLRREVGAVNALERLEEWASPRPPELVDMRSAIPTPPSSWSPVSTSASPPSGLATPT